MSFLESFHIEKTDPEYVLDVMAQKSIIKCYPVTRPVVIVYRLFISLFCIGTEHFLWFPLKYTISLQRCKSWTFVEFYYYYFFFKVPRD